MLKYKIKNCSKTNFQTNKKGRIEGKLRKENKNFNLYKF